MLSNGDTVPRFSATVGTSDHESFDLADRLDEDGTVASSWVADDPTNEPEYDAVDSVAAR